MSERLRFRLGLRSSNAAQPHKNKHREAKVKPPWLLPEDFHDLFCAEELEDDECE